MGHPVYYEYSLQYDFVFIFQALKTLAASLASETSTNPFKGDTSAPAQANDISHLVKRKRKLEDVVEGSDTVPAPKKPTP